jgi:hypothetical protein
LFLAWWLVVWLQIGYDEADGWVGVGGGDEEDGLAFGDEADFFRSGFPEGDDAALLATDGKIGAFFLGGAGRAQKGVVAEWVVDGGHGLVKAEILKN